MTHLPPTTMAPESPDNMTIQEKIRQAQKEQLRSIGLRNRSRGQNNTTSLRDLSLARKPAIASIHESEKQLAPATNGGWGSSANPWDAIASQSTAQQPEVNLPTSNPNLIACHAPHNAKIHTQSTLRKGQTPLRVSQAKQVIKDETDEDDVQPFMSTLFNQEHHLGMPKNQWESETATGRDVISVQIDMDNVGDNVSSCILSTGYGHQSGAAELPESSETWMATHDPSSSQLLAWHGYMVPPPIDWHERGSFDKHDPTFRNNFIRWTEEAANRAKAVINFTPLPSAQVKDFELHADGISLVSPLTTIDKSNAKHYGYGDDEEITRYSQPISAHDFEDWGKLDLCRPENFLHKEECTKDYIRNWSANVEKERKIQAACAASKLEVQEVKQLYTSDLSPCQPEINIYLRPALRCDVPQMAWIYNYYIEHGCRTAELYPIPESDVYDRLLDTQSSNLPFVVACLRNGKSMIRSDRQNRRQNENVGTNGKEADGRPVEKVVGWASANDFTAQHFVERISAELELYVHPNYRQKGVARCLMDQIMQSIDRGYIKLGGYPFHCAPEVQTVYDKGGARDIRKAIVIIRKFTHPTDKDGQKIPERRNSGQATSIEKLNDTENDYDSWMKSWLEDCGFRVEGLLHGVGAKNGRLVDLVYMTRETMWQPTEGAIPDPQLRSV